MVINIDTNPVSDRKTVVADFENAHAFSLKRRMDSSFESISFLHFSVSLGGYNGIVNYKCQCQKEAVINKRENVKGENVS